MATDHGLLQTTDFPRWIPRWATFTACATFVLLLLGAVVTTFRVGMADPIWPTYPWHLLLVSWQEPRPGFLIEHSHRLAGYIVGCCVIVLAVGVRRCGTHPRVRWLGMAALLGVIIQGLLGGFRVKLDRVLGSDLALIHGCFAQIVFGMLVSLAVLTSENRPAEGSRRELKRIRRLSVVTAILVYVQIVFGALFRHTFSSWGQRGHLLTAFAVVATSAWLVKEVIDLRTRDKRILLPTICLTSLIAVQLFLGVEAWMVRMTAVDVAWQAVIRTSHVLVGALIFVSSLVVTLQAYRLVNSAAASPSLSLQHGGEVAA
jgi:cytochrome c oxidase assembly protein subunit 15